MSVTPDRLFALLPLFYRAKDEELGFPLRDLLRIIAEQVEVLDTDIRQLYDDWFIETCQPSAVRLIGALIGYEAPTDMAQSSGDRERAKRRERFLVPRRDVAHTMRSRRRKGTLSLLSELAFDVTGWSAYAVEFFRLVTANQHVRHLRLERGHYVDTHRVDELERIGTPFDTVARSADVRRIDSPRQRGYFAVQSIGVFVWRLPSFSVTSTPAYANERAGGYAYTFSVLGNDAPLFSRRQDSRAHDGDARPNIAAPIRRRELARELERYYGPAKSFEITAEYAQRARTTIETVKASQLVVTDLSDWEYRPLPDTVAIDPELGRLAFPPSRRPSAVWVSYHYGFSAEMGGGEYARFLLSLSFPDPRLHTKVYRVGAGQAFARLDQALATWHLERAMIPYGILEVTDSGVYAEPLSIELNQGELLYLRARSGARPIIDLQDRQRNRSDALRISANSGGRFILDGFLVNGRGLRIEGPLEELRIRHSTLVPGWELDQDCCAVAPGEPSIELYGARPRVSIESSIVGPIQIYEDEVLSDPVSVTMSDSIIDANAPDREAFGAPGFPLAHATIVIERCTVIGSVACHAIELAENSIFLGPVTVARRQIGCVRFCHLPLESRTPRRFQCQPDTVLSRVPLLSDGSRDLALEHQEAQRVTPHFDCLRYGLPEYCRLALASAEEVTRGADDQGELGAFHDLFQSQRIAHLTTRLQEYSAAGMAVGIIFAS